MSKFIEIIDFVKDIISDENKMTKFKEVISGIKELIYDIKEVISFFKKENV